MTKIYNLIWSKTDTNSSIVDTYSNLDSALHDLEENKKIVENNNGILAFKNVNEDIGYYYYQYNVDNGEMITLRVQANYLRDKPIL